MFILMLQGIVRPPAALLVFFFLQGAGLVVFYVSPNGWETEPNWLGYGIEPNRGEDIGDSSRW